MEFSVNDTPCLVYGLRDGSASLYLGTGGGTIGGQGLPRVRVAAKDWVQTALPFAARARATETHPLPTPGRVRFSIFTPGGVRAAEADESELRRGEGDWLPVYAAAQDVMTAFRMAEEGAEGADEQSYVNCLLTAMARGTARAVTVTEGMAPPDPARLTADRLDLEWIADHGFGLDRLSSGTIIGLLLRLAGFRWFLPWQSERSIETKVADHGGETLSDAVFRVRRHRAQGRMEVEIVLMRTNAKRGARAGRS